eukprot:gene46264-30492_t
MGAWAARRAPADAGAFVAVYAYTYTVMRGAVWARHLPADAERPWRAFGDAACAELDGTCTEAFHIPQCRCLRAGR